MLMVPKEFVILMTTFAPLFTTRVWRHVQVLLVGAILAPGKRTVTAALRVMGLAHVKSFQPSHRVLNRAVWSRLEGSRLLLQLLVHTLAPTAPLVRGWMIPSSAAGAPRSGLKALTGIGYALLTATWSTRVGYAG
jgi:DDE superfamily endonuclease